MVLHLRLHLDLQGSTDPKAPQLQHLTRTASHSCSQFSRHRLSLSLNVIHKDKLFSANGDYLVRPMGFSFAPLAELVRACTRLLGLHGWLADSRLSQSYRCGMFFRQSALPLLRRISVPIDRPLLGWTNHRALGSAQPMEAKRALMR